MAPYLILSGNSNVIARIYTHILRVSSYASLPITHLSCALRSSIDNIKKELTLLPIASTSTHDDSMEQQGDIRAPKGGMGCPACHQNIRADSPNHTRVHGQCRWHDVTSKDLTCLGCQKDASRRDKLHDAHRYNEGECRFYEPMKDTRRVGAHPREPRPATITHPTSGFTPLDVDASTPEVSTSSSSSGTAAPDEHGNVHSGAAASASTRGPTGPSNRKQYQEQGAGTPNYPDWTRFDVQRALKRLRSYDPKVVSRELRLLHLRWWHASDTTMRHILSAVGLDEARLSLIKGIVESCKECRSWQKPGNKTVPSVSLPTKFNEIGECDILFYNNDHKIFHIIDRAIRLADGCEIPDKFTATLLNAYTSSWFQRHGPFKVLYSDGEGGLNNAEAIAELKRLGTELRIKAPNQHASII